MPPEELQWLLNFAFEFSNENTINQKAFESKMRKLEAECRKRRAESNDEESLPYYPRTVKRQATRPITQKKRCSL